MPPDTAERRWCQEHQRHECSSLRRFRPVFCHSLAMKGTSRCLAHAEWQAYSSPQSLAHHLVAIAITDGELIPPETCELCDSDPRARSNRGIFAHHEDYARPLDVLWLCGSCHSRAHTGHGGLRAYRDWLRAQLTGTERVLARFDRIPAGR